MIEALERLTVRYGGSGAAPRANQTSHAFLDAELKQLSAMVRVLPPIFLLVAAMLVNMTLSRLITLERELIGLLKAIGYSSRAVGGALYAVRAVVQLPPAVAMTPPAPASYRQRMGWLRNRLPLRQTGVMVARHLFRRPFRTLSSTLGVAMAVAILVASLWSFGSIDRMIDITFFRTERHDAQIVFGAAGPQRTLFAVRQMPGVLRGEPYRLVAARISHRQLSRKLAIIGHPARAELSRVLDSSLRPMALPDHGLILSEALADALQVRPGDLVAFDVLDGVRPSLTLPVCGISIGYVGLGATTDLAALNRLMGKGALVSGANLLLDDTDAAAFYAAAKAAPRTGLVTVTALMLDRFKATLAEMVPVYVTLAGIIAVGVVYNFSRIAPSEQGRELASLRVLGFTNREVAAVLFGELATMVPLAQPLGWLIGYGIGLAMVAAFSSDLYRVPFIIGRKVFATSSLIVLAASLVSATAIRGRINALDMIAVLKTRE